MRRTIASRPALALGLIVALLLWPRADARAQVDVEVTADGSASAGVTVSTLINAIKTPRGTTGSDGTVTVAAGTFQQGERVVVWLRECEDGEVEVILAAEGEDDPCVDEEEAEGERCGCRRLGPFIWGDASGITVDTATGELVVHQAVDRVKPWSYGFAFDYLHFERWDVACNVPNLLSCEADDHGYSVAGFADYRIHGGPVGFGGEVNYGMAPDVRMSGSGFTADATTDFWGFAPYGALHWEPGDVGIRTIIGGEYLWNFIDFGIDPLNGDRFAQDRDEGNWNGLIGTEIDVPISDRWGATFGLRYSGNFSGNDADSGIWRFRFGLRDP